MATAAAIVAAVIGAGASIKGGQDAKNAASAAGLAESSAELEVTMAKLEDLKVEERVLQGQTIAGAAGSGVKVDKGSPLEILAEQARNFTRERQTIANVGATRAASANARGSMAGKQAAYQGYSQGANQLSSAFAMMI